MDESLYQKEFQIDIEIRKQARMLRAKPTQITNTALKIGKY
jgi:hypothetical protein